MNLLIKMLFHFYLQQHSSSAYTHHDVSKEKIYKYIRKRCPKQIYSPLYVSIVIKNGFFLIQRLLMYCTVSHTLTFPLC